jgi:hypothetical protein
MVTVLYVVLFCIPVSLFRVCSFYDCFTLCKFCFLFCVVCVFVLFCVLFLLTYLFLFYLYIGTGLSLIHGTCLKPWFWCSETQWLLYVPPGLTLTNSTFCPQSVFMCFVWISEQRAIISLYSINWLVFITETECVYCAVRTDSLYIKQICFVFKRLNSNKPTCDSVLEKQVQVKHLLTVSPLH